MDYIRFNTLFEVIVWVCIFTQVLLKHNTQCIVFYSFIISKSTDKTEE